MHSAVDIARIFVKKSLDEDIPITQMKLQKLVYFAHGLYLADSNGVDYLIRDKVQAWKFGPVFPSIYEEYKIFGASLITPQNDFLGLMKDRFSTELVRLNQKEAEIVDATWRELKAVSAIALSNWTHAINSAWYKAYNPTESHSQIDEKDIVEDFSKLLIQK